MKPLLCAVLLLLADTCLMPAQTPVWSLDECVVYALQHNCEVLLQRIGEAKSRQKAALSRLELLPTLSFHANQYYNWGRSVDMQELVIVKNRLTRQTSASIGASLSLFDGFATINTISMNRCLAKAAGQAVRQTEFEVKADVARAYLANVLAKLTRERLKDSYDKICLQMERLERAVEAGATTASDLMEMEAKAADVRSQIASTESEERCRMQQLKNLMACNDLFDTVLESENQCEAVAPVTFEDGDLVPPAVEAARSEAQAAALALKVARGGLFPSLTLSAGFGTYYSDAAGAPFMEQLDGNRNPSVSLTLSVPIFDSGRRLAAIAGARADKRLGEVKLRQASEKAALDREEMLGEYHLLQQLYEISRQKCQLQRKRMAVATAEYELGAMTTSQWIDAGEALAQSECEMVQYMCKYLFQVKIMEYYRDGCRQ